MVLPTSGVYFLQQPVHDDVIVGHRGLPGVLEELLGGGQADVVGLQQFVHLVEPLKHHHTDRGVSSLKFASNESTKDRKCVCSAHSKQ